MPSPETNGSPPVAPVPTEAAQRLFADIDTWGQTLEPDPAMQGAIGITMFDVPSSKDGSVTILLPQENTQRSPSQALLRIRSGKRGDGRTYLAVVTAGPFIEPDTLRADSHLLVTVSAHGGLFLPPYHGRIQATILGEELPDGTLIPPRLRPMPNSPVFLLSDEEARQVLKVEGDMRVGMVVGHSDVPLGIPSSQKSVLPPSHRHPGYNRWR